VKTELELSDFVTGVGLADVPDATLQTARRVLLASVGAGIAGAGEDGVGALRQLLGSRGGAAEARTFVFGAKLPAHAAAQFNGTLCRALDFCDALAPGAHLGSSVIPAAFAAAELAGGCTGAELLAAIVVGCEVGARLNLTESMYDGFDPTGVAVVFGSTAAAARLLGLSARETTSALGLALNRCGGTFQSNIDGTLAVRVIQGWVAQTGVECAQLAAAGITGPQNFLTGVYGYAHLFGRDRLEPASLAASLGREWRMDEIVFKKYPSCGATQGLTELTLGLIAEHELPPDRIARVDIRLNPYCHRLVGGEFCVGDNPRVNAQFSAQYCAASAIARGSASLRHFRPDEIADSTVQQLIARVKCTGDRALDDRGHTAVDVTIATREGEEHSAQLDVAPGFPGNALSTEQHAERFADCIDYAAYRLPARQVDAFLDGVARLDDLPDARKLIDHLIVPAAS
jgi:2-methylcitrate dehydratase PrpD